MKAKSYKLKYAPSLQELANYSFREGGSWISKESYLYKTQYYCFPGSDYEFSVSICIYSDFSDWNDFDNVLVLDEEFGQPYTPFYGDNYKQDIDPEHFSCLAYCVEQYNAFMDQFNFLEVCDE